MSKAEALRHAGSLRTSLLDHGVRRVSIELHQGRPGTPNGRWWDNRWVGVLSHHTVSRPSNGNTPVLGLVKRGRTGLPGPLCNGYGGYDEVYRIICMGWANHPGAGGPWTLPGGRIPRDNARPYLWGTEYEGGLVPYTDSMREFMGRANAGIADWLGVDERSHGEHSSWTSRKIDRLGYSTSSGRAELARYKGATRPSKPTPPPTPKPDTKEWYEMPIPESDLNKIADAVNKKVWAQNVRVGNDAETAATAVGWAAAYARRAANADVADVLNAKVRRVDGSTMPLQAMLRWTLQHATTARTMAEDTGVDIQALQAAVDAADKA